MIAVFDGYLRAHLELPDGLHFVAEKFNADGMRLMRLKDIQNVAPRTELAPFLHQVRAAVAVIDQAHFEHIPVESLTLPNVVGQIAKRGAGHQILQRRLHRHHQNRTLILHQRV